jgi:hypothetical protein
MRYSVTSYLKWIIEQFQLVRAEATQSYIYKITGSEKCKKTGEEKLVIQVARKNVFMTVSPKELVKDENTLRGFSPLDVRTITYLALHPDNKKNLLPKKPFYKIISQFFSRTRQEEMFTIQEAGSNIRITKSAREISSSSELIDKFDVQDAHRIGYIAGAEHIITEQDIIKKNQ